MKPRRSSRSAAAGSPARISTRDDSSTIAAASTRRPSSSRRLRDCAHRSRLSSNDPRIASRCATTHRITASAWPSPVTYSETPAQRASASSTGVGPFAEVSAYAVDALRSCRMSPAVARELDRAAERRRGRVVTTGVAVDVARAAGRRAPPSSHRRAPSPTRRHPPRSARAWSLQSSAPPANSRSS